MYVRVEKQSVIEVVCASIAQAAFLPQARFCNLASECMAAPVYVLYIIPTMLLFHEVSTNQCCVIDSESHCRDLGGCWMFTTTAVIQQITVDCTLLLGVRPTDRNESYDRPKYGSESSSEFVTLHVVLP